MLWRSVLLRLFVSVVDMLSFCHAEGSFSVRSVGVLLHHDKVLLQTVAHDDFWVLPGGRVEFGEDAAAAVVREVQEELHARAQVERLLWVVENFFDYNNTPCHSVEWFFLLSLPPQSPVYGHSETWVGFEGELELLFRWFPVAALSQVQLYPSFLQSALLSLPVTPVHIVHRSSL